MSRNAQMVIPDDMSEVDVTLKLSELKRVCEERRTSFYPPTLDDNLVLIDTDLPIWVGKREDVRRYHLQYKTAFDLAYLFYPQANLFKFSTLPAKLKLPQFHYNVTRVSISKNTAKDSVSYGSVGAIIHKCGEFEEDHIKRMADFFEEHPSKRLVCHREFIDFRARMHFFNNQLKKPEKQTLITQFYTTGLIIAAQDIENFEVISNMERNIKKYKNAYRDPIAQNSSWKVYIKKT